jgi:energy-coupling factor transporter ATP-binding protein EcfA2
MNSQMSSSQPPLFIKKAGIRRIRVEQLFGQYTYELSNRELAHDLSPKLLLLYGDNGSGKTTILRLLFFLLSHMDHQNHKTIVSRIRFKTFLVELADGTTIVAERSDDHDTGWYKLQVSKEGKTVAAVNYGDQEDEKDITDIANMDPREAIRYYERSRARDAEHIAVLTALKDLNLGIIYVTDDRRVLTTVPPLMESEAVGDEGGIARGMRRDPEDESTPMALATAVERISSWAARRAFRGSAKGEEDVNSVYAAIMRRLAYASQYVTQPSSLQKVIDALKEQGRRSPDLVRFGLIKPLRVDEIIDNLRSADPKVRDTMLAVVEPYVDGIKARLDALEPVRAQLSAFVDTMNSFYKNKTVHLDVDHGLKITSRADEVLPPSLLSSGEGQLLYLLASTIVAKEQSNLFLIDEPELSLNVKWQRQILSSLVDLTADSNIQFILATHSIELLTRYDQFVRDLNDTKD